MEAEVVEAAVAEAVEVEAEAAAGHLRSRRRRTSVPVSAFQAVNDGRSKNGTCAAVLLPMMPTEEKCEDAPDEYRSL